MARKVSLARPLAWVALAVFILAGPAWAAKKKPKNIEDLFNPLLGPEYSHWLVGPVAEMASAQEIEDYLDLLDDQEATEFIAAFWQQRNAGTPRFQQTPQQIFESRAVDADKRYSEGAFPGRRTDRGALFVLFGEPEEITFEAPRKVGAPTLEVWWYPKGGEPGLSGEPPRRSYRFVEIDGRVVRYTGQPLRPRSQPLGRRQGG